MSALLSLVTAPSAGHQPKDMLELCFPRASQSLRADSRPFLLLTPILVISATCLSTEKKRQMLTVHKVTVTDTKEDSD